MPKKRLIFDKVQDVQRQFLDGNRRILLVDPGKPAGSMYGRSTSLALSLLKSIARRYKVEVDIVNLGRGERISATDYPIVGFTGTSPAHAQVLEFAKQFQNGSSLVLKGGSAETADRYAQMDPAYPIDISFIGYSDDSFARFLEFVLGRLTLSDVPDIRYHDGKGMIATNRGPCRSFILPDPDLLEVETPFSSLLIAGAKTMIRFQSVRGCSFACTFCGLDKNMAWTSASQTVEYLRSVKSITGADSAFCENATFGIDRHPKIRTSHSGWTEEFCRLVAPLGMKLGVQTRVDCLDNETVDRFVEGNVSSVYLGVESTGVSALREVHKEVDGGYINMLCRNISYALSKGLIVSVSIINDLGSEEDLRQTVSNLVSLGVHEIWPESLKLYPGTPLSRQDNQRILEVYRARDSSLFSPQVITPEVLEDVGSLLAFGPEHAFQRKMLACVVANRTRNQSSGTYIANPFVSVTGGPILLSRPAYIALLEATSALSADPLISGSLSLEAERWRIGC